MVSKNVTIVNAEGMHMRPAGMIAKLAKEHPDTEVTMKANGKDIKAKAIMQIMAAGIKKGTDVEIIANGGNEQAVLDEFVAMFEDGFGE
jgi:phosphocarrier protein